MKKIDPPQVDDDVEITELANNDRLDSYPELSNNLQTVLDQYQSYCNNSGDPWIVGAALLQKELQQSLKVHYANPPNGRLEFIREYRDDLSPNLCLMCGSLKSGTLDHYLPKNHYAEFAVFSKNLIPACSCNTLRKDTIIGNPGERIIHPYFDDFLDARLYTSIFAGNFLQPSISVQLCDPTGPNARILEFHLKNVILKNKILNSFEKLWGDLVRRPRKKLCIGTDNPTMHEFKHIIGKHLSYHDNFSDTPNNWHSIFYFGITNDPPLLNALHAHTLGSQD